MGEMKKALRVTNRALREIPSWVEMLKLQWAIYFINGNLESAENSYKNWELYDEEKRHPHIFENIAYFKTNQYANWDYNSIVGTYKYERSDEVKIISRIDDFLVIDMGGFEGHLFCIPNSDTSFVTENIDYIIYFDFNPNGRAPYFKMDFLGPASIIGGKYLKQE